MPDDVHVDGPLVHDDGTPAVQKRDALANARVHDRGRGDVGGESLEVRRDLSGGAAPAEAQVVDDRPQLLSNLQHALRGEVGPERDHRGGGDGPLAPGARSTFRFSLPSVEPLGAPAARSVATS